MPRTSSNTNKDRKMQISCFLSLDEFNKLSQFCVNKGMTRNGMLRRSVFDFMKNNPEEKENN